MPYLNARNNCKYYPPHRYKVADYEIEHVFDEKDLGVIFDFNVSFEEHISAKIMKANNITGLIRRSSTFLACNSFKKIVHSIYPPPFRIRPKCMVPRTSLNISTL